MVIDILLKCIYIRTYTSLKKIDYYDIGYFI